MFIRIPFDKIGYIVPCRVIGVYYIHIGVGSDVVCSILIGNARASICGTDSGTTHAFFMPQRQDVDVP